MRVAFIGKGGAGKSAVAGIFCRLLARQTGQPVVAIDSDPLPGLAISLGLPNTDTPLPAELVEKVGDDPSTATWELRPGTDAHEVVEQYAPLGGDGVRLLQWGKLHGHVRVLLQSQEAFRLVVNSLAETDVHLVGDLPGGTRQPFFGWGGFADVLVVVAEATPSSMLSAKRLANLTARKGKDGEQVIVAIANKTLDPSDADRLAEFSGLRVIGSIPRDPAVAAAERAGVALLDYAPASPAVEAVRSLVDAVGKVAR